MIFFPSCDNLYDTIENRKGIFSSWFVDFSETGSFHVDGHLLLLHLCSSNIILPAHHYCLLLLTPSRRIFNEISRQKCSFILRTLFLLLSTFFISSAYRGQHLEMPFLLYLSIEGHKFQWTIFFFSPALSPPGSELIVYFIWIYPPWTRPFREAAPFQIYSRQSELPSVLGNFPVSDWI